MTATAALPGPVDRVLLDAVRAEQVAARAAEVRMLVGVVEWAVAHPPLDRADVASVRVQERPGERPVLEPLTGEGAPEVSAAAVAELAAALGLSTEQGRRLVAEAVDLAYRLPAVWERTLDGRVPVWQARRIAREVAGLGRLAARFVDRHLQGVVGRIAMTQVERLVQEAVARFDQQRFAEQIAAESQRQHLDVQVAQVTLGGMVPVRGQLSLPDALALEAAVAAAATDLLGCGSTESLATRRAHGLGDLARQQLRLVGAPVPGGRVVIDTDAGTVEPVPTRGAADGVGASEDSSGGGGSLSPAERRGAARRDLTVHVHLTDRAFSGAGPGGGGGPLLGRSEGTGTPISVEAVRRWCGSPDARITIVPVLDLADRIHHQGYEIPHRLREQVLARDLTCVYPGCSTPARRCDLDHIEAYDHAHPARGGPTATENLAPLCRRHHNLKTRGTVSYRRTESGSYLWSFPLGDTYETDHLGTHPATPPDT